MTATAYYLRWYERDPGEALVGELALVGVEAGVLRAALGLGDDDPLLDCYPVREALLPALRRLCEHPFDLGRHEYFVEAEAPGGVV